MVRRGMTLLEMMVALVVLTSLATLTAAAWSSMNRWIGEMEALEAPARPVRALALMRAQWEARRALATANGKPTSLAQLSPDRLEFFSAEPVLHTAWPIVRAAYVIERDREAPSAQAPYRLVLEETPVRAIAAAAGEIAVDPVFAETRRVTLLAGLSRAAWRRYDAESAAAAQRRAEITGEPFDLAALWSEIDSRGALSLDKTESASGITPAAQASNPRPVSDAEARASIPEALELRGVVESEEFAWSFVVAPLR